MSRSEKGAGDRLDVGRRNFLRSAASSGAVLPIAGTLLAGAPVQAQPAPPTPQPGEGVPIVLRVNRQAQAMTLDPRTTLLDALRDNAGLTGTKKGCAHGQCGACTVHINGRRILSCMTFAVMTEGQEITTIEGLSRPGGQLHPMQQAFIDQDAFQCGYCTPGQIMSAIACLNEGHAESDAEIREYMSGNLCRCAAYPNIVAAVGQAKSAMKWS